jgi:hypothetical protein
MLLFDFNCSHENGVVLSGLDLRFEQNMPDEGAGLGPYIKDQMRTQE